jgi:hypothetical protein
MRHSDLVMSNLMFQDERVSCLYEALGSAVPGRVAPSQHHLAQCHSGGDRGITPCFASNLKYTAYTCKYTAYSCTTSARLNEQQAFWAAAGPNRPKPVLGLAIMSRTLLTTEPYRPVNSIGRSHIHQPSCRCRHLMCTLHGTKEQPLLVADTQSALGFSFTRLALILKAEPCTGTLLEPRTLMTN